MPNRWFYQEAPRETHNHPWIPQPLTGFIKHTGKSCLLYNQLSLKSIHFALTPHRPSKLPASLACTGANSPLTGLASTPAPPVHFPQGNQSDLSKMQTRLCNSPVELFKSSQLPWGNVPTPVQAFGLQPNCPPKSYAWNINYLMTHGKNEASTFTSPWDSPPWRH